MARFSEKKRGESRSDRMERKRSRHLEGVTDIDYKDAELLRRFTTELGKILPARLTGATPQQQRKIKQAIRRARVMGMLR